MSRNNKSRYSHEDRKQITQLIENLKNDEDYVAIFEILTDDENNKYTKNSNGVFLNFSTVGDDTLDRITKYLKKINKKKSNQIEVDTDVIPIGNIYKNDRTHKLSNYEQNIIRQRNIGKILDDSNEYQALEFATKSAPKVSKRTESVKTTDSKTTNSKSTNSKAANKKKSVPAKKSNTKQDKTVKQTKKSLNDEC